jgi:hypothetical protein
MKNITVWIRIFLENNRLTIQLTIVIKIINLNLLLLLVYYYIDCIHLRGNYSRPDVAFRVTTPACSTTVIIWCCIIMHNRNI